MFFGFVGPPYHAKTYKTSQKHENANKGITVNVIAPGYVGTDMVKKIDPTILKGIVSQIPVGRLAEPSEIAALASYLSSDNAGFITGATFSINGGQYMQ